MSKPSLERDKLPINTSEEVDKVNNSVQKELAFYKAGATRLKVARHVAESLDAVIVTECRDASGNIVMKEVPDVKRREWACEFMGKVFGDFVKEKSEVEGGVRSLVVADRENIKRRITTILSQGVAVQSVEEF